MPKVISIETLAAIYSRKITTKRSHTEIAAYLKIPKKIMDEIVNSDVLNDIKHNIHLPNAKFAKAMEWCQSDAQKFKSLVA